MDFDFSRSTIAVVGDVMLDCYIRGSVDRISPEAPVPVVRQTNHSMVLGGAANVAANLAALGARVRLIGVIGDDAAAENLRTAIAAFPTIDPVGLLVDPGRPTTVKTRILAGGQQIVRIDAEERTAPGKNACDRLLLEVDAAAEHADVVVISDYQKGVCSPTLVQQMIQTCRRHGKRVIVDPKLDDFSFYSGASIIKPNRKELKAATGLDCDTDEAAFAAAHKAIAISGAAILLTRSEQGMSFFSVGQAPVHLSTTAREVYDVSGAGDTVIAVVAACLASGKTIQQAMRIANVAAGIVVSRSGTAIVTLNDLRDALVDRPPEMRYERGDLVSRAQAAELARQWKSQGLTVGFTNGCFDLLHPGHVSLIRQARTACDRLIVALNTDASVQRLKGDSRPIQNERARATIMGAIEAVELVTLFDEDTPLEAIMEICPDVLVKGADYTEDQVVGARFVKERGGLVVLADLTAEQSTTALIGKVGGKPSR